MKKNLSLTKLPALFLLLVFIAGSCKKERIKTNAASDYDAAVVTEWFDLIKTLTTETPGYTPPVAARAFGYTGVALYEAVQNGIPEKSSLSGKLTDFTITHDYDEKDKCHWPTVAHLVLAEMTKHFYASTSAERMQAVLALEDKYIVAFSESIPTSIYERSVELGKATAFQVIAWSESDGGKNCHLNNFPADYSPATTEGAWQPTAPDFTPALQPYWGNNRPFLAANIDGTQPPAPPAYSTDPSSIFYARAMKVYDAVNDITPEQKIVAEFWSDDPVTTATPPGHSISVLNQLIKANDLDLALAAELFAKLGMGISDAFVSCWKTKYTTNYMRPITYIHAEIDADWNPILVTPPFPEYTSGHSVQSGVLAEILTAYFGNTYQFTDYTHANRTDIDGTPRSYSNFYEMAEEAAISRLYGGIHYDEAIDLGLEQGYQIGKNVVNLNLNE